LGRLIKVDCGTAVWQQNFAYDAFGNITKTIPPGGAGIAWTPGYSSTTNRYTLGGTTYDLDGNLTNDTFHTHAWNVEGKIVSVGSSACGTSGVICLTYDALGRVIERQNGGAFTEFLYSPLGKTAVMTGQTLTSATIPLPGGTRLYYATATNKQIWHKDWLGSVRLVSSFSSRTIVADRAVAPFGEPYNVVTGGGPGMFAENEQAIFAVSGSASQPYDTPNREVHPTQGRWLSPDPGGLAAVDISEPQTWNRYTYVGNTPMSTTDPLGLKSCPECKFISAASAASFFNGGFIFGKDPGSGENNLDGVAAPGTMSSQLAHSGAGVNTGNLPVSSVEYDPNEEVDTFHYIGMTDAEAEAAGLPSFEMPDLLAQNGAPTGLPFQHGSAEKKKNRKTNLIMSTCGTDPSGQPDLKASYQTPGGYPFTVPIPITPAPGGKCIQSPYGGPLGINQCYYVPASAPGVCGGTTYCAPYNVPMAETYPAGNWRPKHKVTAQIEQTCTKITPVQ
jgi:RHS repeat-associated protein